MSKYKTGMYICTCSAGIVVKGIFRKMNKQFLITESELERDDVKHNIDQGHIKYVGAKDKPTTPEIMESEPVEIVEPVEEEVSEEAKSEEVTEPTIEDEGEEAVEDQLKESPKRKKRKNETKGELKWLEKLRYQKMVEFQ